MKKACARQVVLGKRFPLIAVVDADPGGLGEGLGVDRLRPGCWLAARATVPNKKAYVYTHKGN